MEDYIQGILCEVKIVFTVSSFCGFFSMHFLIFIKMESSTKYALLDKIITFFQTRSIKSSNTLRLFLYFIKKVETKTTI